MQDENSSKPRPEMADTLTDKQAVKAAEERISIGTYLEWIYAGGPQQCKHGYAKGIACPTCDLQLVADARKRLAPTAGLENKWEPFNSAGTMCPPDPDLVDHILATEPLALQEEPSDPKGVAYGLAVCNHCGCSIYAHSGPDGLGCDERDDDGAPCGCEMVFVENESNADPKDARIAEPSQPDHVPLAPTERMLIAARDWSQVKYGKPIGNEAAIGCWQAMMLAAVEPAHPDSKEARIAAPEVRFEMWWKLNYCYTRHNPVPPAWREVAYAAWRAALQERR